MYQSDWAVISTIYFPAYVRMLWNISQSSTKLDNQY